MFGFEKKTDDGLSGTTSMQVKEKLELRKKTLDMVIKEKTPSILTARCVFVLDTSGSMGGLYRNGTVQDLTERLMPLALKFDDDGQLEVFGFSNHWQEFSSANEDNLAGFVNNVVMKTIQWGGTNYAPIIRAITDIYGVKNPSQDPTFVIFQTDGANVDKPAAREAMIAASKYNIFWKFVGIGRERKDFLEELDDMTGRVIDNANFFNAEDITSMSDEDLYRNLLEEYPDWQVKARMQGILR